MSALPVARPSGLKVLVLSHMFPRGDNDWNGIFVLEQVAALREMGVDARVVCGDAVWFPRRAILSLRRDFRAVIREHPATDWRATCGVPTLFFRYPVPYAPWWGRTAALSYSGAAQSLLSRVRTSFPFDLVHAHTAFLDGICGLITAKRFKVPLIVTEHTGPFSFLIKQKVMRWQTGRVIRAADRVIAVSRTLREEMITGLGLNPSREIDVVPNGVDTSFFRPPDGIHGRKSQLARAIWIGSFISVKQPLILVEAFALALGENPYLSLTMVGEGELKQVVQDRISELGIGRSVTILPAAQRSELRDHIWRHDFLVVSSATETFGLVALEALSCGRPVLTTRCGGPAEIVQNEELGEVVENSVTGLRNGFLAISVPGRSFKPDNLHSYAAKHYTYPRVAKTLIDHYVDVTKQS